MNDWIKTFPDGLKPLPKKPLVDFINWELYLEKKGKGFDDLNKFLDALKDFNELVDLFKAAKYLEVKDLIELISARIAYQISKQPFSSSN